MTPEQAELWRRIEAFALDEPEAAFPFTARLAEENGWNREHARRVAEEYKRFAFLAVAAGHPVTPSKAIDEAWHLHLIYTRSYWADFCPRVLGRPLHHEPSRGSAEDEKKFAGWYAQTCESYERLFGGPPPPDVWPSPAGRAAQNAPSRLARGQLWLAVLPLLVAGCAGTLGWPLDLAGPAFLRFFFFYTLGLFAAAAGVRFYLRGAVTARPELEQLTDVNAAALLAGGPRRAVEMATAKLYREGLVTAKMGEGITAKRDVSLNNRPVLERRILETARFGAKRAELEPRAERALVTEIVRLRRAGLVLTEAAATRTRMISLAIALLVPATGAVKIGVGLSRGRPVELLVVGTLITTLLALVMFVRRPWRSRAGDRVLARWCDEHRRLKQNPLTAGGAESFPLAVALFGFGVLPAAGLGELRRAFYPVNSGGDGATGSSCSSSGGSSCGGGGGSSCGGCSSGSH